MYGGAYGYPAHVPTLKLNSATGFVHSSGCIVAQVSGGGSTVGTYTYRDGSAGGTVKLVLRHAAGSTNTLHGPFVFGTKVHVTITGSNKKISTVLLYKKPSRTT